MFKNKKDAAPVPAPAAARRPCAIPSIISGDMIIHGNLESTGDVQIEGAVMGDIAAAKLVIADGGSVSGNVVAADVRICGALTGSVRSEMVTLTSTARVMGDIFHDLLAIETGGRLEGQSRRLHPDAQTSLPAPEPAVPEPAWDQGEHQHHNGHDQGQDQGHNHHHDHHHDHGENHNHNHDQHHGHEHHN